ncbi:MAG: VacJ family lipoprotein [Victivallales bacterium]|nr:VacJ family lipoprotein [Victivallales bacterium]
MRKTLVHFVLIFLLGFMVLLPAEAAGGGSNVAHAGGYVDAGIPGVPGIPELLEIDDPLQGMNRAVFEFNDVVIMYAIRPISAVYTGIIPEYLRERLGNIDGNLQMPRKVLSNLLRARWEPAGIEFCRFLINTTVGIAGAYDPAADWWGLKSYDSSFAAAFAEWGIPPGIILFIPIYGGITSTDIFGKILDLAADPLFWASLFVIPFPIGISIGGGFTLNSVSMSLDDYIRMRDAYMDTYIALRNYIYVRRIYEFWH